MINFHIGDQVIVTNRRHIDYKKIGTVVSVGKTNIMPRVYVRFSDGRLEWKLIDHVTLYRSDAFLSKPIQFWMVKSVMVNSSITLMYNSKEAAQAEAARLANSYPGNYFAVMEAVEMHYVPKTVSPEVIKF